MNNIDDILSRDGEVELAPMRLVSVIGELFKVLEFTGKVPIPEELSRAKSCIQTLITVAIHYNEYIEREQQELAVLMKERYGDNNVH